MKHGLYLVAIYGGIVAVVVVARKYVSKPATRQGATGGTAVPYLDASNNDPITEAAFNQSPSDTAGAFGADENVNGEEVTSLQ